MNLKRVKNITLITTAILTGVITAFSGPNCFCWLSSTALAKLIFNTSNH
ncbi:MAG: hypothetical protein L3J23_07015 [Flavobacteriaceae bacterium]|nr:hypothetical protein [Flavobacteriaceae bacterium]